MSEAIQVVCPNCSATNRLPAARLGDAPTCGRCKGKLFAARRADFLQVAYDKAKEFIEPLAGPGRDHHARQVRHLFYAKNLTFPV